MRATEEQRRWVAAVTVPVVGGVLSAAVIVMAARVGDAARFVSWPVVGFTALASAVALVGLWVGLARPWQLAAGLLPAMVLSYVLPAFPFAVVALVVVGWGGAALLVRGVVAGIAAGIGLLMVVFVVIQGPAASCGESSVSSSSGPWWIRSPSSASGSGSMSPDGTASGTTQVGQHHYAFRCVDGRLASFERVDE